MKNIPSRLQQHTTTLVSVITTIALTLISDFVLGLPKEITWLTFFIGATVTVATTLLELRLLSAYVDQLNSKIKILSLIDQIEDSDLRELAEIAMENCIQEIEGYRRGFIPVSVYHHQRNQILKSTKNYRSVTWIDNPDDFIGHAQSATWRGYYDIIVEVAKKNIAVEQVFVMSKKGIIDAGNRFSNAEILALIRKYQDDGILVRVSWLDEWQGRSDVTNLYQSFGIVDNAIVIATVLGINNRRIGTMLIKQPSKVREYGTIYERLRQLSRPLDEILKENLPITS